MAKPQPHHGGASPDATEVEIAVRGMHATLAGIVTFFVATTILGMDAHEGAAEVSLLNGCLAFYTCGLMGSITSGFNSIYRKVKS